MGSIQRDNEHAGVRRGPNEHVCSARAVAYLTSIRRYLVREAGPRIAKSTLTKIKDAFVFLSRTPGAGHVREDLTSDFGISRLQDAGPLVLGVFNLRTQERTDFIIAERT